jgi:DNA-nicking Smr family endonuclease
MPPRRLNPEETQLWAKVVASVRPIRPLPQPFLTPAARVVPPPPAAASKPPPRRAAPAPPAAPAPKPLPGTTLDGTWDRRLSRGLVAPDFVLNLHGHNLATAYDLLDRRLELALAADARLLLLITGKPPGPERPVKRGAIRGAVGDWLAASRHAGSIAAVRSAHPRHGGAGALYIVLRRRR